MQDNGFNEELPHGRSRRKGAQKAALRGGAAGAGTAGAGRDAGAGRAAGGTGRTPGAAGGGNGSGEKAWKTKKKAPSKGFIIFRRIIILALLEAVVLAGIFPYAFMLKQYNKIQRPDFEVSNVENKELSSEDIQKMKGYWNIAAFGVDSRDSSVGRGNNSDVIMIVSINRETGEIRLVSVFRDSYLNLGNSSYSKINAAYAIGGPEQAVRALNQNLDLNITDYVTFNWKAVATGVNILGGVDVNLSDAEFRYINSYITETVKGTGIGSVHLEHAGENHLDGVQAVAYARLRYMDNDYTRTERQRRIIELCYQKAKKADAQTLSDLAGNMLAMVATSLTWEDGMNLAMHVRNYSIGETGGFPFDRAEAMMGKKGACVLPKTLESNVKQLHQLVFDDTEYEVSNRVREIDNKIWSDYSTYKNQAAESRYQASKKAEEEAEEDDDDDSGDGDGSGKKGSGDTKKEKKGVIYETNSDGDVIAAYETNSDGDIIGEYEVDADGNLLRDDEDEADLEDFFPGGTDEDGNFLAPAIPTRSTSGSGTGSTVNGADIFPGSGSSGQVRPGFDPEESAAASREEEEDDGLAPAVPGGVKPTRSTQETAAKPSPMNEPGQTTDSYVAEGPGHVGERETTAAQTAAQTTAAQTAAQTTAAAVQPAPAEPQAAPGPQVGATAEAVPD